MTRLMKGLAYGVAWITLVSLLPWEGAPAQATDDPARAELEGQNPACATSEQLRVALKQGHEEEPVGMGLGADGNLFQVYASKAGGWTMVRTNPAGIACIVAVGEMWQSIIPDLPGQIS